MARVYQGSGDMDNYVEALNKVCVPSVGVDSF